MADPTISLKVVLFQYMHLWFGYETPKATITIRIFH